MNIVFISNYINHHQIPFCEEMIKLCGESDRFYFIQTQDMEQDRKDMGWGTQLPSYVLKSYESEEENKRCRQLIFDSEVVIFGGCEDESYISPRLEDVRKNLEEKAGAADAGEADAGEADDRKISEKPLKITFRYSERLYREGQWKCITPKGLIRKYKDHTRYKNCPVYLLAAGAYVPSDFGIIKAYPGKMLKWGYFTEVREYDIESLLENKGWGDDKIPYIIWAGRLMKLKHPELAVLTAEHLSKKGLDFHMDIIGGGEEEENIKSLIKEKGLEDKITMTGMKKPGEVREAMEKADILLFTSNRLEGWGAVVNEAMNSGCAVIAGNMAGAVPYLIKNGVNGCVFADGQSGQLLKEAEKLVSDKKLRRKIGENAYITMRDTWNPANAAKKLMEFIESVRSGQIGQNGRTADKTDGQNGQMIPGPCSPVYPESEKAVSKKVVSES